MTSVTFGKYPSKDESVKKCGLGTSFTQMKQGMLYYG